MKQRQGCRNENPMTDFQEDSMMSGYENAVFVSCWFWVPYLICFGVMLFRHLRVGAPDAIPDAA
jgi:hypothetical protein